MRQLARVVVRLNVETKGFHEDADAPWLDLIERPAGTKATSAATGMTSVKLSIALRARGISRTGSSLQRTTRSVQRSSGSVKTSQPLHERHPEVSSS